MLEGIDAHLPELYSQLWAEKAAALREAVSHTMGEEQANAKQALRDHYETQFRPETSRDCLVEEAIAKAALRAEP